MGDDVLDRERLSDMLYEEAPESHLRTVVLAHDATLRERVAELEDLISNIGGHVDDGIAGRITADHAVGEVAAELDDFRARRALDKGEDDG